MQRRDEDNISLYVGGCLCGDTTYEAKGEPINPHLCSCTMCQKSSGAPTVGWVEFSLTDFKWTKAQPKLYRSSEKTDRCSCARCGGLLGTYNEGFGNICLTISTMNNPSSIVPGKQHSYIESKPSWWQPKVVPAVETVMNTVTNFISNNPVPSLLVLGGFFAATAIMLNKIGPCPDQPSPPSYGF